ncbi:MAG TPA: hypothetical protein VKT29_08725 [Terriglobales bacterium]|nr:hypothetical protein [Terriglobales bacterium]
MKSLNDFFSPIDQRKKLIYGISPYFLKKSRRSRFLLGYSRMRETEIGEGIRRLSQVL